MTLISKDLFGKTADKVKAAISRIKKYCPDDGYYLAFSGGKDSVVLKRLAEISGVLYEAHYHNTTVDPPELVRFIKEQYKDVIMEKPKISMYNLVIKKKMPPTRIARYCCAYLKEWGGEGRTVLTGIRHSESYARSKRKMYEQDDRCKDKHYLHPMIDWTTNDVWEFIRRENIPYCELYDEGFTRLGCVLCPMGGGKTMKREAERWPKIKAAYIRSFDRAIQERDKSGLHSHTSWTSGDGMYEWWIRNNTKSKKISPGQETLYELGGE